MDRIFQNIRADFLEILKILEIPSLSGFPKFPKWPDLVDRIFQNIRADFLEILESGKLGARIFFGNFGIEFGRAGRHPSDDRPCTTTQLRGYGLCIYIHICLYLCLFGRPPPPVDRPCPLN